MRFIILLLFCCLLVGFRQDDGIIVWQKSRPLTWDDFKGKPEHRFAGASTHYLLKTYVTENNGTIEAHVLAWFFSKKSWKKERWVDNTMLRHEQKHFDIVELYARKLRRSVSHIAVKNKSDAVIKLDSLYAIYDKEMDVFQDRYDNETDNSMQHDNQISWENKIDLALDTLKDYESPVIKLKIKNLK